MALRYMTVAVALLAQLSTAAAAIHAPRDAADAADPALSPSILAESERGLGPDRRRLQSIGECAEYGGRVRIALVVADPGGFSGSAEAKYYLANLKSKVELPKNQTICGGKTFGTLMGIPVLVVTTGIGPITAALCVTELIQCRPYISALLYTGTSGWSAQIGGILNADGKGPNPSKKTIRLGDICINPFTINWECQQTDWTQQCKGYPNVNSYPQNIFGPTASFLYGQCVFTSAVKASVGLSRELLKVARSNQAFLNKPKRIAAVLYNEEIFWGNMTVGTGIKYDYKSASARTNVFDYKTCAEIDGQFFYSGVPWDMSARNFTAILLNEVWKGARTFTQKNVLAVSAMEAIGVAFAIQNYNGLITTKKRLPYTIVRGNSNWLHSPVYKAKDGSWRQLDQERDFATGYGYAIASYSSIVLTWLQNTCIARVKAGTLRGPASTTCAFALKYP